MNERCNCPELNSDVPMVTFSLESSAHLVNQLLIKQLPEKSFRIPAAKNEQSRYQILDDSRSPQRVHLYNCVLLT